MLIVLRCSPVAAPAPSAIGEDADGGIAGVQNPRVGALAVEVWRGILRLEGPAAVDEGIEKRIQIDRPAEGVQRP